MEKLDFKKHLKARLKIVSVVFALVGWFMLVAVFLEDVLRKDLSGLEDFIETSSFQWGIKIFVIVFLVILIKVQVEVNKYLEKHSALAIALKVVLIGGLVGWGVGLASLLV